MSTVFLSTYQISQRVVKLTRHYRLPLNRSLKYYVQNKTIIEIGRDINRS